MKEKMTVDKFVQIWNQSYSIEDAAKSMGYLQPNSIRARMNSLKKKNRRLKFKHLKSECGVVRQYRINRDSLIAASREHLLSSK